MTAPPLRSALAVTALLACTDAPDDAPATMRCVATGIADPRTITTAIEPTGRPSCDIPPALATAVTEGPALYAPDATIGELHCTGLPPGGEVTLSLDLRARPQVPPPPEDGCHCDVSTRASISAQVNGVLGLDIPALTGDTTGVAEPCTVGPDFRRDYRVPVTREGTVHVRLTLRACHRDWTGPQRCLFVRGTEVRIAPR
jgi:hypothetical protein